MIIGVLGLSLLAHGNYIAEASDAANVDVQDENGNISVLRCAEKGGLDFGAFLDAVIWNDGREGVVEPWNDVFYRNQCHTNDIIQLINHQDGIRSEIRKAFLSCETEKLPNMKKAYSKITAEIFYVRHIVDGGVVLDLPFDILQTRAFAEALVTDRNKIYSLMKDRFVKKDFFEADEFDDFFTHLEIKYNDRKNTYIQCPSGTWQEVADKWQETVKFFTEDYGGLKDAAAGIAAEADELKDEFTSIKTIELFTTKESFSDYLGSFVETSVNGLPPKEGFSDILDALKENAPNVPLPGDEESKESMPAPNQEEFMNALSFSEQGFKTDVMRAELMANFAGLYGTSSEGMEEFINQLDGRSSKETEGLIEIIDGTFKPLNAVLAGTKTINDRQCPGN